MGHRQQIADGTMVDPDRLGPGIVDDGIGYVGLSPEHTRAITFQVEDQGSSDVFAIEANVLEGYPFVQLTDIDGNPAEVGLADPLKHVAFTLFHKFRLRRTAGNGTSRCAFISN